MFLNYLEETLSSEKVVVFPGRFGPFHLGHLKGYEELVSKFGKENVFILTKNYPEEKDPKNPFSYVEKKKMMIAAGIPENKIFELKGIAYNHLDIIKSLEGIKTKGKVLITVMSDVDKNRIGFGKTKEGKERYYRDVWRDQTNPLKIEKGGYVYVTKTVQSEDNAKISASNVREAISKNKLTEIKNLLPIGTYNYLTRKYMERMVK